MNYFLILISLLFLAAGCNRPELIKAKIFERKVTANDQLVITFQYVVDDRLYTDSATIKNKILQSDSINVIVDPKKPAKAIPDIKD
jgi:hypothetical protein